MRRRQLEDAMDAVNEEMARLRAQGVTTVAAASGAEVTATLDQQMEEHRKEHQKHVSSLRDELAAKQEVIDSLKE